MKYCLCFLIYESLFLLCYDPIAASVSFSAASNAIKIHRRISIASSIVFKPGAKVSQLSLPK
jgi:hypothetical protein